MFRAATETKSREKTKNDFFFSKNLYSFADLKKKNNQFHDMLIFT